MQLWGIMQQNRSYLLKTYGQETQVIQVHAYGTLSSVLGCRFLGLAMNTALLFVGLFNRLDPGLHYADGVFGSKRTSHQPIL